MDIQSEIAALQATRDEAMTVATADEVETVATEEVATPTDDAVADTTETEVTADTDEDIILDEDTVETEEEVSDDSFDDLLEDIPSNEVILKTYGNRVPQATKDALIEYADGYRNTKAQLDAIGGEQGAKLLAPLSNILTKPEVGMDDAMAVMTPLMQTNPEAISDLMAITSLGVLFTDNPQYKHFSEKGDAVLQMRFGEGNTAEKIEKLIALEKGGYIDVDADLALLQSEGTASNLYQQQAEELRNQTARIQELERLVENPHLIEQKSAQQVNAHKDLDAELEARVAVNVTPFRERGRWSETSALTKLVMRDVLTSLKDTPDYKEAVQLVSKYGTLKSGDAIPFPVEAKLANLIRQAKGKFGEAVLAINKERRAIDETSANVKVAQKVKETTPKAEVIAPVETVPGLNLHEGLLALRKQRDEALARA